ncbi:FAD-binding oxidoreductase [Novosphingobium sp. KCTC 2891]|uniref:FAD-binding oxidoreductase n=1 Tax=Novosphingobium sp. KCTC 2891 TaxID=2989730 RepID=UPI002222CABC|nr:FAD-binding oxidoreductase [Novosphingobium sp. KCTC 2891]MCW1385019.1 FAD-binding oxidoreductase [Novosphingobium sp. KCTC 2891]
MNRTEPASPDLIDAIRTIVGERGMLLGEDARARSCDPFRSVPVLGPAIVRPADTDEVARVLALCHARGQRVVTHGGRTGVAGGAIARADELVISLERMNAILDIDPIAMTATVEAGATLEAVQQAAEGQDLLYPIDLGAKGTATIGGTIATNAGGNRVIRWGMTRQNVLGLEAVLADGTIVSAMNRFLKNNTGYDIKQAFIGSEGTLGIVTKAVLRLTAMPCTQNVAFVSLPDYASVLGLLSRARRLPQLSAFEVMWQDYYHLVASHDPARRPVEPDQPFYAIVEAMGFDDDVDEAAFAEFLEKAFSEGLIADAVTARSQKQVKDLWQVRESSEILVREMGPFVPFDVSIDIARADAFAQATRTALSERFGDFRMVTLGHLGDSNIHVGVHIGPETAMREIEVEECVYGVVHAFEGALTAEHGIGQAKRAFLPRHVAPGALDMMHRLRDAMDEKHLLNRDVLF